MVTELAIRVTGKDLATVAAEELDGGGGGGTGRRVRLRDEVAGVKRGSDHAWGGDRNGFASACRQEREVGKRGKEEG